MPDAPPTSPDVHINRHRGIHALAFISWLFIQLLALALSAGRFPLSSRFPKSGEQFALIVMLVSQVIGVSMLCPLLLRDIRGALAAIAIAWPMVELAAFLADAPLGRAALSEIYVSFWILTLALWIWALPGPRARLFVSPVALLLAIAGPLLWYLHAEFVLESSAMDWPHLALLGPIMGAISLIVPIHPPTGAWWFLGGTFCSGVIAMITSFSMRKSHPA